MKLRLELAPDGARELHDQRRVVQLDLGDEPPTIPQEHRDAIQERGHEQRLGAVQEHDPVEGLPIAHCPREVRWVR